MSEKPRIDWDSIRARLEASEAALDATLAADPERLARVYAQRAAQLAARRREANEGETWPALAFTLGAERFCLPLSVIAQVLPLVGCAPTPGGPPELLGVMNVRGEICSVLDLARLLNLPLAADRPRGYVVLVRHEGRDVGLRVDEVERIENLTPETLVALHGDGKPLEEIATSARAPGQTTLLNLENLLAAALADSRREKRADSPGDTMHIHDESTEST
jgi:purine-binding chemotaxis protein CheW